MMYYTLSQLSAITGRTSKTIREHIKNKWLAAEKVPGARGWRVSANKAQQWAAKYFGIKIEAP